MDAVWAHVHKQFMKLVEKGDLPSTDDRSVAALKLRFALATAQHMRQPCLPYALPRAHISLLVNDSPPISKILALSSPSGTALSF